MISIIWRPQFCICLAIVAGSFSLAVAQDRELWFGGIPNEILHRPERTSGKYREVASKVRNNIVDKTDAELTNVKTGADDNLAIAAAWELLLRKTLFEKDSETRIPIEQGDIQYFLGFVEGRLNVAVPVEFANYLRTAKLSHRRSVKVARELPKQSRSNQTDEAQPDDVQVEAFYHLKDDRLVIQRGDQSWSIDAHDAQLRGIGFYKDIKYHAAVSCNKVFVCQPICTQSAFTVLELDQKNNSLRPFKVIAGGPTSNLVGLPPKRFVELECSNGQLFVFGLSDSIVYIEAFDVSDGKNVLRFNSEFFEKQ